MILPTLNFWGLCLCNGAGYGAVPARSWGILVMRHGIIMRWVWKHWKGSMPYKLTEVSNPQGHKILFYYDGRGCLSGITDSAGRELEAITDNKGRIIQVSLKPEGKGQKNHVLVKYGYNDNQDLETITDAMGQTPVWNTGII